MFSRNEILRAGAQAMWDESDGLDPLEGAAFRFDSLGADSRTDLMVAFGKGFDAIWPMLKANIQERFDEEWARRVEIQDGWRHGA